MKRKMALILAAVLAVSAVFTSYAMNAGWGKQDTVSGNSPGGEGPSVSGTENGTNGPQDVSGTENVIPDSVSNGNGTYGWRVSQENLGPVGQIDVSIASGLVLCSSAQFHVSLTGNGVDQSGDLTIGGGSVDGSARTSRVSFENLEDGTYVLTVTGQGFLPFSQSIQVEGKAYAISLTTGFLKGMNYAAGAAHPGVLVVGDVNGDGVVDEADGKSLVDAIHAGTAPLELDLNKDGVVNLSDLEYFTKGFGVTGDTQATPERSVPAKMILAEADESTKVQDGTLEGLLRGSGGVNLVRADGASIGPDTPVKVAFDFAEGSAADSDGILIEARGDNAITDAVITVVYEDETGTQDIVEVPVTQGVNYLLSHSDVTATQDHLGNIKVSLGGQVAMKRVTLTIFGMKKNTDLAEITKVEFLNGMEERIPEPQTDIPQNLTAKPGDAQFVLNWDPCVNVTGYEVLIKQGEGDKELQFTTMSAVNSITISSFGTEKMKNYQEYHVSVQSVNGNWRSGYSNEVTVIPLPDGKPEPPDNVSAEGHYQSILVSWKDMDDTISYRVYYRERDTGDYQMVEVPESDGQRYTITGLKDLADYQVYVTGINEHGESRPSVTVAATTTDLNPAVMHRYHLLNMGEPGEEDCHIISASSKANSMFDSPLDTQSGTAWGTIDKNPSSYYKMDSWDDGGYNPMGLNHGLTYEFDQAYKIDSIAFHDLTSKDTGLSYAKVRYWDESGKQTDLTGVSLSSRLDADGRRYYVLKFPAVTAKKIQFGLARYTANGNITISEVYFYHYDELMEEIMALYEDDLHTVLRPDVTQADIDALRVKINTVEEISGEYHPDRALLERELQTAEAILRDEGLNEPVVIHSGITTKDVGRGFGGLNAWQPLGVTAAAQEKVIIYVGHKTKKTGENSELQLVVTQYYSSSDSVSKVVGTLKVGANEITVPKIWTGDVETGGALYVQYTGNSAEDVYKVRVSGGVQVPILDLYQVTDSAERQARVLSYMKDLETYVAEMEANHTKHHAQSDNALVNKYAYDRQTCILGASDILLDTMMFSLPAPQILAGAGSGTAEVRAQKMLDSMDAMEDMMYLFYQHKGLNKNATEAINQIPKGHQNIRYQRMFAKAFMYASGNHIGIGWGSASGMVGGVPVVADETGKYVSGQYFGWGIAHEIGHCINQGAYAVAEVTNNYFAVLAQAHEGNGDVRFQYPKVYEKVTSGTKGRAGNVFTQLGMYWQLHLSYDRGYNYKTYENYQEQLANLFFARVDTYARNPGKAPKPGGIALTLAGDSDQQLMRLACAAAEKDILKFFEQWGMTPDADTIKYAGQFAKETRAIWYANDESRAYWLEKGTSSLNADGSTAAVGNVTAQVDADNRNQVKISLSNTLANPADLLGYEITRYMMENGEPLKKEIIGFVTDGSEFIDTVTINNRVMWYEVRVVDQYLNYSAPKALDPVKIEHDGSLDKTFWSISTTGFIAKAVETPNGDDQDPCDPEPENPAVKMIDNDSSTVYEAVANGNAEIVLNFNKTNTVTGFKYTGLQGAAGNYEIYVQTNGEWLKVADGTIVQGSETVYFASEDKHYESKGYVSTYGATAVKFVLKNQSNVQISITELDVLGVTGDNVDFRRVTGDAGAGTSLIGTLNADYVYDDKGGKIPAGSIVFMGAYKGSWAYNVVVLYDQDGNVVGGKDADGMLAADSIFLAPDPTNTADITETTDGTWVYWIEPQYSVDLSSIKKVRAELYRVNNASTNKGERLVSDSLFEQVPATLPGITLDPGTGTRQ